MNRKTCLVLAPSLFFALAAVPVFGQAQITITRPLEAKSAEQNLTPESVPEKVFNVFQASVVGVTFYGSFESSAKEYGLPWLGTAFVVGDRRLISNLHNAYPFPDFKGFREWWKKMEREGKLKGIISNLRIEIVYGPERYPAKILDYDIGKDLILLQVFDLPWSKFVGQPLSVKEEDLSDDSLLADPKRHLFSFGYSPKVQSMFVEHGGFLEYIPPQEILLGDEEIREEVSGVITDKVSGGFSESPLLDRDGSCRGVVFGQLISQPKTVFIPADQLVEFLERNDISIVKSND